MDLIDRIKRIDAYKKWHPDPEPPPECPHCNTKFYATGHWVDVPSFNESYNKGGKRYVVISARTRIQMHVWARTLIERDADGNETRTMTCRPPK